jgi:class 3 adenylate cyclase
MKFPDRLFSRTREERKCPSQTSVFIKLSSIIVLFILVVSGLLTILFLQWQKNMLYRGRVDLGKMMAGHLAGQALLPLLEEDTLALNTLIQETKEVEGFVYAMVVDRRGIIRAHTDPARVGTPLKNDEGGDVLKREGLLTSFTSKLASGASVLNLSRSMTLMNKRVGSVSLGLSMDALTREMKREAFSFLRKVFFFSLILMAAGVGVAYLLTRWLSPAGDPEEAYSTATVRNQAAVLYTGVKGFKDYADTRDPEEVLQNLSEYVSIVTGSILDYGGYVAEIVGDTVIGVFRSSPLESDHTLKAVRSAVAMQKTLGHEGERGNRLLNKIGISISSGVILSGYVDSHAGKKPNDIGESFKAAQSLNKVAGPGEILISRDVYRSVENLVSVDPIPPQEVTQKTEAWESFRVRHIAGREPGV